MQTALAPRITGCPKAWARDMAIVGGATSFVLPALLANFAPGGFPLAAGVFGAASGATLGLFMPALLDAVRGRLPIPLLLLLAPALGAAWGGISGGLASIVTAPGTLPLGVTAGGIAGALQFGWWWFPYTFQTVRGGRTLPVVVAGFVALPVLTALTFFGTLFLLGSAVPLAI